MSGYNLPIPQVKKVLYNMETANKNTILVYSSWADIIVDENGYILDIMYHGDVEDDEENYIKDIKRFDLLKTRQIYKLNDIKDEGDIYDILELGFWSTMTLHCQTKVFLYIQIKLPLQL